MINYFLSNKEEYPSLAEGVGLENREAGQTARGFKSLFLRHLKKRINIGDMEIRS